MDGRSGTKTEELIDGEGKDTEEQMTSNLRGLLDPVREARCGCDNASPTVDHVGITLLIRSKKAQKSRKSRSWGRVVRHYGYLQSAPDIG